AGEPSARSTPARWPTCWPPTRAPTGRWAWASRTPSTAASAARARTRSGWSSRSLGHGYRLVAVTRLRVGSRTMPPADRFKEYAPDVHAVVRLEEALPPGQPVHVFVDLVRSIDPGHFVIPPGP